jgi:hypothetical protein
MSPFQMSVSIEMLTLLATQQALQKNHPSLKAEHFWLAMLKMVLAPLERIQQDIGRLEFVENIRVEILAVKKEMTKARIDPVVLFDFLDAEMQPGPLPVDPSKIQRDASAAQIFEKAVLVAQDHHANALVLWHFYQAMISLPPLPVVRGLQQCGAEIDSLAFGGVGTLFIGRGGGSEFPAQVKVILGTMDKNRNLILVAEQDEVWLRLLDEIAASPEAQGTPVHLVKVHPKYAPANADLASLKDLSDKLKDLRSERRLYFILPSFAEIRQSAHAETYLEVWNQSGHRFILRVSDTDKTRFEKDRRCQVITIAPGADPSIPNEL